MAVLMIENSLRLKKSDRSAFMKLPIEERRRILAQQAEAMVEHYQQDSTWQDWTSFSLETDYNSYYSTQEQ